MLWSLMIKSLTEIWTGRASLNKAFWLYSVLLYGVVVFGGYFLISRLINQNTFHWNSVAYLAFCVLFFVLLFVGLVRSAGRHIQGGGNVQLASIYQALGLLGGLGIFYLGLDAIQLGTDDYTPLKRPFDASERNSYQFALSEDKRSLHLSGIFDLGATKALRALLQENPNIDRLTLESKGGHIYAARGVAKELEENTLDTHVPTACASACVVVFAAGKKRTLALGAKLGFHQYAFDTHKSLPFKLQDEQQKELDYYLSKGVSQTFVDKVFSVPASELWLPAHDELLQSGLVHEIVLAPK